MIQSLQLTIHRIIGIIPDVEKELENDSTAVMGAISAFIFVEFHLLMNISKYNFPAALAIEHQQAVLNNVKGIPKGKESSNQLFNLR